MKQWWVFPPWIGYTFIHGSSSLTERQYWVLLKWNYKWAKPPSHHINTPVYNAQHLHTILTSSENTTPDDITIGNYTTAQQVKGIVPSILVSHSIRQIALSHRITRSSSLFLDRLVPRHMSISFLICNSCTLFHILESPPSNMSTVASLFFCLSLNKCIRVTSYQE